MSVFMVVDWTLISQVCLSNSYKKSSNQTASIACDSGVIWTAWCKVILEKLTVSQLVEKYFTFYETGRFVTFLMRTYHLSVSWAIWIVHVIQFCSCKIHFDINFHSIFRLTKSSLPVNFPHQHPVYFPILPLMWHVLLTSSWTSHKAPQYTHFSSPKMCCQFINVTLGFVVTYLQMAVLTGHTGMITAVHFCPMARGSVRYLVSTSSDGSVSFWSYNRLGPGKYTFLWVHDALAVFTLERKIHRHVIFWDTALCHTSSEWRHGHQLHHCESLKACTIHWLAGNEMCLVGFWSVCVLFYRTLRSLCVTKM